MIYDINHPVEACRASITIAVGVGSVSEPEPVVSLRDSFSRPRRGRITELPFYRQGILFNPFYRVVNLYIVFTTGFGLRPPPAAIIVMTPLGSGKEKLRERLQ